MVECVYELCQCQEYLEKKGGNNLELVSMDIIFYFAFITMILNQMYYATFNANNATTVNEKKASISKKTNEKASMILK